MDFAIVYGLVELVLEAVAGGQAVAQVFTLVDIGSGVNIERPLATTLCRTAPEWHQLNAGIPCGRITCWGSGEGNLSRLP